MQPFHVANTLLNDGERLRQRFQEDGYLFLRNIVDPTRLLSLRRQIVDICARMQWFKPGSDPMEAIAWTAAKVEGEADYFLVYDEIQKLEAFHALAHDAGIVDIMRQLLGETAFPHPLSIARLMFPFTPEWSTPPHQDFPNNQGTQDLYACWMPLSDCPQALGSLSILRGSHRFGLLPLDFAMGPGHRQAVLDERLSALPWVGGDFQLGDIIIFHSLTVHRALPNDTDRLRLSVDYRFQRERDALVEECLQPHFQRLSWETIYENWNDESLKFYWRNKSYDVVPRNAHMHDLPDEHMKEAVRQSVKFNRRRAALNAEFRDKA